MPAPAFRRQPDRRQPEPAAAAAWFAGIAGQAILASEADTLRQAAQDRPGQAGLWLSPSGMGEGEGCGRDEDAKAHGRTSLGSAGSNLSSRRTAWDDPRPER